MKAIKFLIILFLASSLFYSCKKNKELDPVTFSGQVNDPVFGTPVANASIKISVQQSSTNSVFNAGFNTAASTTTDANGNYSVTFTPENPITYRLTVEKNFYFSQQTDISSDAVNAGSTTTTNFNLNPYGWFRVNFKNVNPFDANDIILFQNTSEGNGCSTCCSNAAVSFTGMTIDTFIICPRVSHPSITYGWLVTKNGNITPFNSSTTAIFADTAVVIINY